MQPFFHPKDATDKIGQLVLEIYLFESVDDNDDRQRMTTTDDRALQYYKLTLWVFHSGELIRLLLRFRVRLSGNLFLDGVPGETEYKTSLWGGTRSNNYTEWQNFQSARYNLSPVSTAKVMNQQMGGWSRNNLTPVTTAEVMYQQMGGRSWNNLTPVPTAKVMYL